MRLLCIALCIGLAVWMLEPPPLMACAGFFMTVAIIGARLFHRLKLPSAAGVVLAGFIVGISHIFTPNEFKALKPIADLALAWAGLSLGTQLTRPILTNQRLVIGSAYLYFCPTVITLIALFVFGMPWHTAIPLGIISGFSAPIIFLNKAPEPNDTKALGLLTTALGALLLTTFNLVTTPLTNTDFLQLLQIGLAWLVGLEIVHWLLKLVRTPTANICSWLALTLFIAIASWHFQISALFLALPTGSALSLRPKHGLHQATSPPQGETLITFALAFVACGLVLHAPLQFGIPSEFVILICALIFGKIVGGVLMAYQTSQPKQAWLPLLPQSLIAVICIEQIAPGNIPLLYLGCTGLILPLLYPLYTLIAQKIGNGPFRTRERPKQAV